jgi:hypothetical protein
VDSGNKYGFAVPTDGNDDDLIEDAEDKPGKILGVNDSDSDNNGDGDGIPGFADGFDLDSHNPDDDATGSEKFVPVLFKISDAVDLENATLWINYDASDPGAMSVPEPGQPYVPAGGILRLWTVDASAPRTEVSVTEKTPEATKGFYVPPGSYSGANLGKLGFSGQNKKVVLFAEGVRTGVTEISGYLEVHIPEYDGDEESFDAVRLTVIKVDLDVDSDNNNGLNGPDHSDLEDQYEDKAGDPDHPGKFVQVNDGDKDNDGIPDFADGFNAFSNSGMDSYENASEQFTPLTLELPACVDPQKAMIRIKYPGSACGATRTGEDPNYTYAREAGKLRIWNCPGSRPRSPNGIAIMGGGDFIQSEVAYPACSFSSILYIEGISPSTSLADCRIVLELDPFGTGDFIASDAVRVMAVQVNMEMQGVLHAHKTSQGGFIALNDDDDDGDQVEDRFQTSSVAEEDNLIQIAINQVKPQFLTGEVTLHHSAGNPYGIRIWDNPVRSGSPLTLPKTWQTPSELPAFLYVEGYAASEGVRDHQLALAYYISWPSAVFCDFIKITVVDVETVIVDPVYDEDSYDVPSTIKTGKPKQHFVTVKGEQYITLVATITPDTEEVRSKITWSGMDQDPTNRLRARKTREYDSFYPATVNVCGKTAHQLVNWVVWAIAGPVILHDYWEHIMADSTQMGQFGTPTDGGCTVSHQIWPPSIITDSDRPDLSGNLPEGAAAPNVPPGDSGVQNQGKSLAGGANMFWDSSRQIRRHTINLNGVVFGNYQQQEWFTNYPDYPSDEVCGNDDRTVEDEDNDPYSDPHFRDVWGEDSPWRPAFHAWGVEGDTFEVHVHMRSFARLLLGNKWYRISDWTLWRVHFKFKKKLEYEANLLRDFNGDGDQNDCCPVWRNNGTFISMGNEDF